jgi:N-acetylmuramoyl-L-alanine amidase/FG-GAP-like repeat
MPPSKIRFVTACQQLLALGVVLAALTPAASVVSLDVVRETPGSSPSAAVNAGLAVYTRETQRASRVPTAVVDPAVSEYALTAAPAAGGDARLSVLDQSPSARGKVGALPDSSPDAVTSVPEAVAGYGAVGVTWEHGVTVPEGEISLKVRTRTNDAWSGWMDLDYDNEHGPDPSSEEARHARPGTDALLVGDVDQVQVRAVSTEGPLPPDMKLAVVDPGAAATTAVEKPALDTGAMDGGAADVGTAAADDPGALATEEGQGTDGSDRIDLQAATFTPKPMIYSRAQWGADERMRDKGSLHYFEVHAGFVHHTVNANNYSRAEVPAIIRSIYAYHTQSRGWSDIGYNFLVDRFGRIWEGRYGGVDRPVVGAHTLNYNDYAFAMSAIGNYDIKQPSPAMIQAYGALFAWKLSLHGVDASSTKQRVGSRNFQAINGHRDAASTACPGRYLYAKIPRIRQLAAQAQRGWAGRELESNLASTPYPDLIVRRASDGKGFIIPTGGMTGFRKSVVGATGIPSDQTVVASPDLTGDGIGDLVVRSAQGTAWVRRGTATGTFGPPVKQTDAFAGHDLITAAGDLNGDGRNDLVARRPATGRLDVYLGRGDGRFTVARLGRGWAGATLLAGAGDLDRDGHPDLLSRDADGALWLYRGTGDAGFRAGTNVPGPWKRYSTITGYGDFDRDGRTDLFVRVAATGRGYVVSSNGNGTFSPPIGPIGRTTGMGTVVGAAQLAGNSMPDLVTRTRDGVLVSANRGTVETGSPIATRVNLSAADLVLNAGDWDRDGFGDMIIRSKATGALYLRRGDGTGHFARPTAIGSGFGTVRLLAAVGDMTGDGYPDLMGQPKGGAIRIYPGNGVNGFRASYVAHAPIDARRQVSVGRWNGDGAPDSLFRKGSKLTLFPGNGPGGLSRPRVLSLDLAPYDWVVGVSDVRLTGHPDLIVREKATGYLWLIQGTASGFEPRRFLADGMNQYDLAG